MEEASRKKTSSFRAAVVTMFTGTVLAQAIPFLASPILARLYDAPAYAVLGAMLAVFNVLLVLVTGRYELAVLLPKKDRDASHLVRSTLMVIAVTSCIAYFLLRLFHAQLEASFSLTGLSTVIGVVSLLSALGAVQQTFQQWLLRHKAFNRLAQVKVVQAIAITVATIVLGLLHWQQGLIHGYLIGWTVFTMATYWAVKRFAPLAKGFSWSQAKNALYTYRAWPLYNSWPALMTAIAQGLAVIYMTMYFDEETAGQHNFARQYLLAPMSMFTVALSQVLFERISSKVRDSLSIRNDISQLAVRLFLLAAVVGGLVFLFGADLFTLVFGKEWNYAGNMAKILVWGYVIQSAAAPFGNVLVALGKVKATVIFPAVFLGLMILPTQFRHWEVDQFIALLAVIEVIAYLFYAALVWYHVRRYEWKLSNAL